MTNKKEGKGKKSGSHSDNDLSKAQKIMKDNDIPFFYSDKENNEEEEDGAGDTD